MAQDFWASSGYAALRRTPKGLVATEAWLARFLDRHELVPPPEAGPRERAMHARLKANPAAAVAPEALEAIEDADARENWAEFLKFRERLGAHATLEACYADLFRRGDVDLAPPFVDALAQAIVRHVLEGTDDPWLARAGELFFRRQRLSTEGGQVLAADAATIEVFAETGGFGNVGRLLRQQNTPVPQVKMDVMSHENAALYFLRDELHGFVLDITPGSQGAEALARVMERWIAHLAGVAARIEPLARIDDPQWRWHVGLDVDASEILDALYRGEALDEARRERLALLFRLEFREPRGVIAEMRGRPVYLALACRPDRTLRMKPQNLLANLPLEARH